MKADLFTFTFKINKIKFMRNIWLRRWMILITISFLIGSASSLFLWGLEQIQSLREIHHGLIFLLPLVGIFFHFLYQKGFNWAQTGTNDLVLRLNEPKKEIDKNTGLFILLATWLSHLVGASVGREGTAVIVGGSLASHLGEKMELTEEEKKIWIRAGIAAGFASVFGTPLAGCFFGLEISKIGQINMRAFLPCLFAGFLANFTSLHVYGTKHPFYPSIFLPSITPSFCASIACIGLFLGAIGFIYKRSESIISKAFAQLPGNFYSKGLWAGIILLGIFQFSIFQESQGLGSEFLLRPFHEKVTYEFPLFKSIATLLSLGVGFKGGEATPLFLIGSHFATSLSSYLAIPFPLLAAIGFTCLYHGLSKTPIAGTIMGIELFGLSACLCFLICTIIVMYVSGQQGIFKSQTWSSWIPKPMYK